MISEREITVPRKFPAVSMCTMASSIYFNVLLHYNFPHQKHWHLFNFQEDELVFLHYKIKVTTIKTLPIAKCILQGKKRPACSVMAISQLIIFLAMQDVF